LLRSPQPMTEYIKYPNAAIVCEGWPIIGVGLLVTIILWGAYALLPSEQAVLRYVAGLLGVLSVIFVIFSLWFFRNPERVPDDSSPDSVISAADGTVLKVEQVNDPRYGASGEKISIFMSPFNVHVNRSPVTGTVEKVEYVPGKFFAANLDKASLDNERNLVIVKSPSGVRIGFLQIAGFIARRIVCRVKPGDELRVGQRYGMIRFGSRMEMFLPAGSRILVKTGDAVIAGKTVVGRLSKN
jgi:phosphatidylserine decarboxylase